ncbi:vascular endothelial growth factor D isoform X1 [Perca flavescens]|uniref:vascular endothelial growth factor D isoform X1 n=1 Tax=Perca flavescens TaxID=8167 RepID=UPI00106DE436|nr:vascular endothelial growth factor D isoform X1 [Perca flavescens]
MMKMKRTLCRISCLVTLVVELSWINVGHSMHREGGSRVMKQWERKVRSASSLDELLMLADFPDWKLWKCRLRLQQPETLSSPPSVGSHRSTRYAAESYSLEILKAIDEEWQRTQCMPRETCVDVAKELGTDPSMFFKPPCVSIHRCSGCCNQEGVTCRNTTTVYVNKTVLSVIPFNFVPEPVLIKVANHTECRCMEPAIIRRNAQPHRSSGCSPMGQLSEAQDSKRLCASGFIWDCSTDRCIPYPSSTPEFPLSSWMPDCEIDVERCDCLPRPGPMLEPRPIQRCQLNSSICAHRHQRFDQASCRTWLGSDGAAVLIETCPLNSSFFHSGRIKEGVELPLLSQTHLVAIGCKWPN